LLGEEVGWGWGVGGMTLVAIIGGRRGSPGPSGRFLELFRSLKNKERATRKGRQILGQQTHGIFTFSFQLQNSLWPSPGSGSPGGPCLVSPEGIPSPCMSPYAHSHGNVSGFMGVPASPAAHPGIYSIHSFPPALGGHSFEPSPDGDCKSPSLVSLRVKPKEPPGLLNWTT
jgi:hypothetical protein